MDYPHNDYLYHHGILGQRWGVRRTPEQLGHVSKRKQRKLDKAAAKEADKAATTEQTTEERKAAVLASRSADELYKNADLFTTQELQEAYNRLNLEKNISNLSNSNSSNQPNKDAAKKTATSAAELYKNRADYTTQELQEAYNRLQLERNIANLTPTTKSRYQKTVDSVDQISKAVKTGSDLLNNGINLYNNIAKIYNSTTKGKSNPLTLIKTNDQEKKK